MRTALKEYSPPVLPLALTALLLLYPSAVLPMVQFELGGASRTYILWQDWWNTGTGPLITVILFLGWCALGATAWKQAAMVIQSLNQGNRLQHTTPGLRFAVMWESPVILAMGVVVCALSLEDLGSVHLLPGFYCLLALGLVTGLTRFSGTSNEPEDASAVDSRRTDGSTIWALILTGFIFYIPAMLWPVAVFTYTGHSEAKTILGSVSTLLEDGKLTLALILFVASIAIPLLKLGALTALNIQYRNGFFASPALSKVLHTFIRITGRWALLDLFVVVMLFSLVDFGLMADVTPEPAGIFAFCGLVITTLLAAESYERRLTSPLSINET